MEAVGRLAGGIAHDFNNLLTAIIGTTALVLEDLGLESRARLDIQEIEKAAKRAAGLTRQLLIFSRQQVLEPRALDLNALVANLEKMLHRLIGEDIELRTKPAALLGAVRAVFHNQRAWARYGTRARDGLRYRQAERRVRLGVQRAGPRHHLQDLSTASGRDSGGSGVDDGHSHAGRRIGDGARRGGPGRGPKADQARAGSSGVRGADRSERRRGVGDSRPASDADPSDDHRCGDARDERPRAGAAR